MSYVPISIVTAGCGMDNVTPMQKRLTKISGNDSSRKLLTNVIVSYPKSHSLIRDSQHRFTNQRFCSENFVPTHKYLGSVNDVPKSLDVVNLYFQKTFDKSHAMNYFTKSNQSHGGH